MPDLYPRDILERELAHHLAPVKAPESLWDAVAQSRSSFPRPLSVAWNPGRRRMMLSPALVLILLMAGAGAVWKRGQAGDLRSDNAAKLKLSAGHSVFRAGPAPSGASTNQFSEPCLMCHTGAVYVAP